jgi:sugar lactone lactonase YvrE
MTTFIASAATEAVFDLAEGIIWDDRAGLVRWVDAVQASCPAFVGPKLDVLAITTAQEGLDGWTDRAGAIFVADVGTNGQPVPRWVGSTITPSWKNPRLGASTERVLPDPTPTT